MHWYGRYSRYSTYSWYLVLLHVWSMQVLTELGMDPGCLSSRVLQVLTDDVFVFFFFFAYSVLAFLCSCVSCVSCILVSSCSTGTDIHD